MKIYLYAVGAIVGSILAVFTLQAAFAPGGVWGREPPDYADNASAYCAEGVAMLHRVSDYQDFASTGIPAIKTRGPQATFACPARSWRGAFVVHVRALCGRLAECTRLETVESPDGRIVWSAEG